jgi:hypothetical protein
MTNAPTGAFTIGHVGWAYLVNRDTGQWEYGANEGPNGFPGDPSKVWLAQTGWPEMIKLFTHALPGTGKHPDYYHKAKYYVSYRCESTGLNDSSNALSTAEGQIGQDYSIPTNDCLSNAVDVLRAYGATLGASYINDPAPNDYFNHKLTFFESAKKL